MYSMSAFAVDSAVLSGITFMVTCFENASTMTDMYTPLLKLSVTGPKVSMFTLWFIPVGGRATLSGASAATFSSVVSLHTPHLLMPSLTSFVIPGHQWCSLIRLYVRS